MGILISNLDIDVDIDLDIFQHAGMLRRTGGFVVGLARVRATESKAT
jgi:hypothetical protein